MKTLLEIIDTTNEPNILQTIKTRGGKRKGAGRKRLAPTKTISFRVRLEYVESIKTLVKSWLTKIN